MFLGRMAATAAIGPQITAFFTGNFAHMSRSGQVAPDAWQ